MKLDYFLAKCPRCGTFLTFDQMGCDHCAKCDKEFKEQGDYKALTELSIKIMDELDTRHLIIPSKKLEELEKILSCSESETK